MGFPEQDLGTLAGGPGVLSATSPPPIHSFIHLFVHSFRLAGGQALVRPGAGRRWFKPGLDPQGLQFFVPLLP